MTTFLGREPVLFVALVQAVLTVATAFGLDVTAEQMAAVELFTLAVMSFVVRSRVTPV